MEDETLQPTSLNAEASEPMIYEPDTTESEATLDSHHSEHGTFEMHEELHGSNSGADDIGPAEDEGSANSTVADVQEGMHNVSISDS